MRQLYTGLCICCVVFGFFILFPWLVEDTNMTNTFRFISSIFWSGMLLLALYSTIPRYRGTWYVRQEGIEFTPLHGPSVSLRWDEIRRVKWVRNRIILEGDKEKIGMAKYGNIFEKQFKQARERIQRALSAYFDLTIIYLYGQEKKPRWRIFHKSSARIIMLSIAGFIVLMAGLFLIHFLASDTLGTKAVLWIMRIWLLSLLFIPVAVKTIIDSSKYRRLNPPWRERIKDVEKSGLET